MFQSQDSLDEARNAGCAFKMTDIRLYRADNYRIVNRADRSNSFRDGLELLTVACLRSCAVALDVASLIQIQAS